MLPGGAPLNGAIGASLFCPVKAQHAHVEKYCLVRRRKENPACRILHLNVLWYRVLCLC